MFRWRAEIAADLKAQGNTLFAARKFRDAIGFYTRALDEVGNELPVEERRVLWSNRAAGNLELGELSLGTASACSAGGADRDPRGAYTRELWSNPERHLSRHVGPSDLLPEPDARELEPHDDEGALAVGARTVRPREAS